jgi:hypothetical protein
MIFGIWNFTESLYAMFTENIGKKNGKSRHKSDFVEAQNLSWVMGNVI